MNAARLDAARRFMAAAGSEREDPRWRTIAVVGHGAGGAAWGVLGAATVMLRPDAPEHLLVTLFIVAIFAVFQAANPSRYPAAYYAWIGLAIGPPLVAALLQGREVYVAISALGLMFLAATMIVGRSTQRLMVESTARELERARLMQSLIAQKAEVDEANRAKTRFLAAASHDLRQPMQAITLLVESLQERAREPATREIVESIRTSVGTMAALLNAILDISRFDAGTVSPERSHFEIEAVLERLRQAYAEAATRKGLELRVRASHDVVETDPVLLYRILSNLVSNALRYTERGRVLVCCRPRGHFLRIEVRDSGPGIPEARQREVFQEFVQLGNRQRDRQQGLGLGLPIVERTARLLGHALELRSRPGRGSVFAVTVGRGDPSRVRHAAEQQGAPLNGCSVLLIEDDREVLAATRLLLEGWGCTVHVASSGANCRDQLARLGEGPAIAIADYSLPGDEDGVTVLDTIRRRFPQTAGILVSGDIAPEVLRRAQASGYTLLHKPLRPARLRALMGHHWRSRMPAAPPEAA
ncbi:MAG TPA: hybrid sensor histidine kinase/response regulator [Usitatibacter sp.]|nr:hybrid sensor histidine kinase/response regulator [Usitatibacter sp.]